MALTCLGCGDYAREILSDGKLVCVACGRPSTVTPQPVLVVTGAAGSGKSTVCAGLASSPNVLALDGDVLAAGAAAASEGRRDYPAFWRYLLDIAREVHNNGVAPLYCCICLPEQVLEGADLSRFTAVHFLALTCDEEILRRRILQRAGGEASVNNLEFHLDFNRRLARTAVPSPHTFTSLSTSELTTAQTIDQAGQWAADALLGSQQA